MLRRAKNPKYIPAKKKSARIAIKPKRAMEIPLSEGINKSATMAARDSKAAVKKNHGQNLESEFIM